MTICARSGRCSRRRPRVFQRTVYRPGEVCQFDVWRPRAEVPVGHGQTRRGWVVVRVPGLLARRRRGAGVQDPDRGPVGRDQRLPGAARRPAADAGLGPPGRHPRPRRPTRATRSRPSAASCGWGGASASRPIRRPRARLSGCRATRRPTSSPAACFANELDFQDQLDGWFAKVNARTHKTLRERPVDRLAAELERMAALPAELPDTARRWVTRVAPDPHLRVDTNDYSLDPGLVGRRVEVCGRSAPRHRGRAGHRRARLPPRPRVRAAPHDHRARARPRPQDPARGRPVETPVEVRPLARYDALIA